MRLIVNTPCKDRKELEKIENEYINEYSVKYNDKLLNKRCNPLCKIKKITHRVEIENEEQLRIRAGLEKRIKIKERDEMFVIDIIINNIRIAIKVRFKDLD